MYLVAGAGGHARETAQLCHQAWPQDAFGGYIGTPSEVGQARTFGPVLCSDETATDHIKLDTALIHGLGAPAARRKVIGRLLTAGFTNFPTVTHPTAQIGAEVNRIGRGNVFCFASLVTTDVTIGEFNLFNFNSSVGHDAIIGSFCTFNPGSAISGGVRIGDGVLVGAGAVVKENVSIASDTVIGAGAVVVRDILEPGGTYVGVPARRLK